MPILKIPIEKLYISSKIQDLCLRKGKSFPNGCPNYGKKQGCPPQPLLDHVFDLSKPLYIIYTEFNIKSFAGKMQSKHPNWTEKQCYNPRYWQQTARKQHTLELDRFLEQYPNTTADRYPEGHGLNVHVLMFNLGIKLEWPPRNLTRIVSVGGYTK